MQKLVSAIRKHKYDSVLLSSLLLFFGVSMLSTKKLLVGVWHEGQLNEFASAWLYASDLVMIFFIVIYSLKKHKYNILSSNYYIVLALGIFAGVFIVLSASPSALIYRAHFIIMSIFFYSALIFVRSCKIVPRGTILLQLLVIIIFVGVSNAVIGITQFLTQKSLGLSLLSESIIGISTAGVAKVNIFGDLYVRAFGLFPHPNIFAGFIVLSIASTFYVYKRIVPRGTMTAMFYALFTLQITALALTFSRSAFLAIFLMYVVRQIFKLFHVEQFKKTIFAFILIICATLTLLNVYLSNRVTYENTFTQSLNERSLYNNLAIEIITNNPLVGSRESMTAVMDNYDTPILEWQYQPTHNIYMLFWAENGTISVFFVITSLCIWRLFRKKSSKIVPRGTILDSIFLSVLVVYLFIGAFDHYFITIQQGMLMLGIALMLYFATEKSSTVT